MRARNLKQGEKEKEQKNIQQRRIIENGRIRKRTIEMIERARTGRAFFRLIRPAIRKKLEMSENEKEKARILSPQSFVDPRFFLFSVQCHAYRGKNQSRYHHPATMTIVRISKGKTL